MNEYSQTTAIEITQAEYTNISDLLDIPLCIRGVKAGTPSPIEGFNEKGLDFNRLLNKNSLSTFLVTVSGNSMIGVGIHDGDWLVVDKSLDVKPGKVVIASVGDEYTVKSVERRGKRTFLKPHAPGYEEIDITDRV